MREKGRAWAGVRSSSGGGKLSDRRSSLRTLPFCTTCPRRLLPLSDIVSPSLVLPFNTHQAKCLHAAAKATILRQYSHTTFSSSRPSSPW